MLKNKLSAREEKEEEIFKNEEVNKEDSKNKIYKNNKNNINNREEEEKNKINFYKILFKI